MRDLFGYGTEAPSAAEIARYIREKLRAQDTLLEI